MHKEKNHGYFLKVLEFVLFLKIFLMRYFLFGKLVGKFWKESYIRVLTTFVLFEIHTKVLLIFSTKLNTVHYFMEIDIIKLLLNVEINTLL